MPFLPLPHRQNGKKKLPSFFGIDGDGERDTTTDKILQYIPGKASTSTSCPTGCIPTHPRAKVHQAPQQGSSGVSPMLGVSMEVDGGVERRTCCISTCVISGGVQCGGSVVAALSSLFLGRKGK